MTPGAGPVDSVPRPREDGALPGDADPTGFGDRVAGFVDRRRSQIVLGLDPDPARLWPRALELADGAGGSPAHRAARAVAAHCRLVVDAAGEHCVAVKPQVACFERLGAPGWEALAEVAADARDRGLLLIADAKRGDIDISARAYGQAFFGTMPTPFGEIESLGADLLTVNPLLGRDALAPLVDAARAAGGGVLVLARTSNPGAADVQDRALQGGGTVSEAIARMVDELGAPSVGASGLADVGAVTGATVPQRLEALRGLMPHAVFLLPGIGPQGGSGAGLAAAFAPGAAGGLVSASRAIVYAHERGGAAGGAGAAGGRSATGGSPGPDAAAGAEAARLRELIWNQYA